MPFSDRGGLSGQPEAIRHKDGPMLVLAGPGSGKTHTIIRRVRCLIEEYATDPSSILVITFTKAAAMQMKERFRRLTQGCCYPVSFGTFHAVYYHILQLSYQFPPGNILTEAEKTELIRQVINRPDCPIEAGTDQEQKLLALIGRYKNNGCQAYESLTDSILAGMPGEQEFYWVYRAYEEAARAYGKLDFEDMVLRCWELFVREPSVLAAWQSHFRYILVDEFQDINPMQYEVLRMLALPENNLFVVGDDDQSIYSFRSASPELMLGFMRDYPGARQVELSVNYRSTAPIVELSQRLIRHNKNRYGKHPRTARTGGERVRVWHFESRERQNEAIARELYELSLTPGALKSAAVIYRTNRDAGALAERLTDLRIPYVMREQLNSPYRGQVALDLMAYLSFAMGGRRRRDFYRIMNRPVRYLSRSAVDTDPVRLQRLREVYRERPYMQEALRKLEQDIGRLQHMDLYAAVNYIRRGMGYDAYLIRLAAEQGRDVKELVSQADYFQEQAGEYGTLEAFCSHISSYEEDLRRAAGSRRENAGVNLLTMHASKGLEYSSVYLPDLNEGIVPHRKSMRGSQVEEERRMLYVAMTRAKDRLTLSWVSGTKEEPGFPSRFLYDMGLV